MARKKFATLTEQMYYILLALQEECCGVDVMEKVRVMTKGRVSVGPGTLYTLLGQFVREGLIRETHVAGRRRDYVLTPEGEQILAEEYRRLVRQVEDGARFGGEALRCQNGVPAANMETEPGMGGADGLGTPAEA